METVFKSFLNRLKTHPLRGFLTILSVALGSGLLILVFNLTLRMNGTLKTISSDLSGVVVAFNGEVRGNGQFVYETPPVFSKEDIESLKADIPSIGTPAIVEYFGWIKIRVGDLLYTIRMAMAASPSIKDILKLEIIAGDFFSQADADAHRLTVVIGESASKLLFGGSTQALGKLIVGSSTVWNREKSGEYVSSVKDDTYTVVGVFRDPPPLRQVALQIPDYIVPIWDARAQGPYDRIVAKIDSSTTFERMKDRISRTLKASHGEMIKLTLWQGNWSSPPIGANDLVRSIREGMMGMSLFFGVLGIIALLVSAFGISSIIMVGILERTREIGLRRAIGCTKAGIVQLFMADSAMTILIGIMIGAAASYFANVPMLNAAMQLFNIADRVKGIEVLTQSAMDIRAVIGGAGLTVFFGLLFSLFPAISASRVSPIECLRGE